MRVKKNRLYILAGVLVLSLYFYCKDIQGLFLFYIFAPIAGLFLYIAIKNKHITLSLFCAFFFLAHSISPSFFFLNKDKYTYSGWTAVKSFNFEMQEFLNIYAWMFGLMFCIVVFTLLLSRTMLFQTSNNASYASMYTKNKNIKPFGTINIGRNSRIYTFWLIIFIVFLAIPLSIFMYNHLLGITGLIQPTLPYRLTGVLYYTKRYIVPILIFILYLKSTRSLFISLFVLFYALIAGLTSASRSALILVSLPALWCAFVDRRMIRLGVLLFIVSLGVSAISLSRSILYAEVPGFLALVSNPYLLPGKVWELPFEVLNLISGRLYGAQDVVLAYQYVPGNQIDSIMKLFLGKPLEENYALAIYGFNLPVGKAYGVGFGLMPWLIALSSRKILVLISLGFIIAIFLSIAEKVIKSMLQIKRSFFNIPLNLMGYPASFFIVYFLYGANLKFFYISMFFSLLFIFLAKKSMSHRYVYRIRTYKKQA